VNEPAYSFNAGKEYSCGNTSEDESRLGSCHSCSTHGCFIEHLQVFGIISGVVMVIILQSRISQIDSYHKNQTVNFPLF